MIYWCFGAGVLLFGAAFVAYVYCCVKEKE